MKIWRDNNQGAGRDRALRRFEQRNLPHNGPLSSDSSGKPFDYESRQTPVVSNHRQTIPPLLGERAGVRADPQLTFLPLRPRNSKSSLGFTMMEIAICLAIIGIALVAIIGVLPIGMNVQQDNRQQTIVGQDASVFMEAIRNGELGLDDLTNYVYAITNYWTKYSANGVPGQTYTNGYTYSGAYTAAGYPFLGWPLTNGANILGLMSTPEYIGPSGVGDSPGQPIPSLYFGGISNHVVAYVYSMSGSAVEKPPQNNPLMQQDSFGYRIYCVNTPMEIPTNEFCQAPLYKPGAGYGGGTNASQPVFWDWAYWQVPVGFTASGLESPGRVIPGIISPWAIDPDDMLTMALNQHNLRLTFEWPQLANGHLGSGRQTFRTVIAGQLARQPSFNPANPTILWNSGLYYYQSQLYTNAP